MTMRVGCLILTLASTVLAGAAVAPAALADDNCPNPGFDGNGNFVADLCEDESSTPTDPVDDGDPGGGGSWTPPDDWDLAEWLYLGVEDDGTPCTEYHSQWMPEEEIEPFVEQRNRFYYYWRDRGPDSIGDAIEDCQHQPAEEEGPSREEMRQIARETVEDQLELPDPQIQPGTALTGLHAYLEVGAPTTYTESLTGEEIPLTIYIDASAVYRIDWGDGTVTDHASSGAPYPDGDITHAYENTGDHVVTVTPIWSAEVDVGGMSFEFSEMELVSSSVDLPVEELQSVRTSN